MTEINKPLHDLTVAELAASLRARQVSAVEAAQHFLARSLANAPLGCFLAMDQEVTLAQARAADARLASGTAGPLEGVPMAHKDIFVTRDFSSTAGSKMLELIGRRSTPRSCAASPRLASSRLESSIAMNSRWDPPTRTLRTTRCAIRGI